MEERRKKGSGWVVGWVVERERVGGGGLNMNRKLLLEQWCSELFGG